MKVYRLKHVPTGLYFCPMRRVRITLNNGFEFLVNTNVSEQGKFYTRIPTIVRAKGKFFHHELTRQYANGLWMEGISTLQYSIRSKDWKVNKSDWVVEEHNI